MHFVALRTALAGLTVTFGLGSLGVTNPSDSQPVPYVPHVLPNGQIPPAPWWDGTCDKLSGGSNSLSARLGAAWDGLVACGPGTNEGGRDSVVHFFTGSWGELEWQCVELSMRWMYLAWGVPPYPANGNQIVDNYARYNQSGPKLTVVQNGTQGVAPQPGDVLELDDGDSYGHTEVVTSSAVDSSGNGAIEVITQNLNSPTNGWYRLTVKDWEVNGGFGRVVDWLHNPAWSLQEPIVSELSSAGTLSLKVGALRGASIPVASDIAKAVVVGGGGSEPAPLVVVLTSAGTVEASYDLPGAPLWQVASGATEIAAVSGEGPAGEPTIGWLTANGDFYLKAGALTANPVLIGTNVRSIALGSGSSPSGTVSGYVTKSSRAYVQIGNAGYVRVANGVQTLSLAGGGPGGVGVVEGYVGVAGRAFVRAGPSGSFNEIGPASPGSVSQVAVATVGPLSIPLISYLTTAGEAYAEYGSAGFVHELARARAVVVAAGHNLGAFPLFGVEESDGSWLSKDASLSSPYAAEGPAVSLDLGALVVS
ncbi:MAG: CHAP domain-containing protein [Acidimicrobiales bacterium]